MKKTIQEGKANLLLEMSNKISKKLPVFYNPIMKNNRDITILLLNAIPQNEMQIALPLAASGVRGIRFLKELKKGKIKSIFFNDHSKEAVAAMKKHLTLNGFKPTSKISVHQMDASLFLLESSGFDYIDLDPFGSPNPFLDAAVKRLSRTGIVAVTATDTSNLAGTFRAACIRKYWAIPLDNELRHEMGLRILIRKAQLIGAQYEKALVPIYSYFKDHYYRIFFQCEKGKKKVDEIIKQHGFFETAGPLWLGSLWDQKLARKVAKTCKDESLKEFLEAIAEESLIPTVGFYDIHAVCKKKKMMVKHKRDDIIAKIKKAGYRASKTHFTHLGVRSEIPLSFLYPLLK